MKKKTTEIAVNTSSGAEKVETVEEKISYTVNFIEEKTNLKNALAYSGDSV